MTKQIEFEIIDHGCDGEQYFPGCGVAFSKFTDVVTGIGDSAREAAEDAFEQMAQAVDATQEELPVAAIAAQIQDMSGTDDTSEAENPEWHHYVSIRWRTID